MREEDALVRHSEVKGICDAETASRKVKAIGIKSGNERAVQLVNGWDTFMQDLGARLP